MLTVFDIDEDTGIITTKEELDREETPVYILIVRARDMGPMPRMATANVTIFIIDENDNSPMFTHPDQMEADVSEVRMNASKVAECVMCLRKAAL